MRLTYRGYNDVPLLKTDAEQTEVITKLAAYEDAEEQGLFVRLPCKVGDTLYAPTRNFVSEFRVSQFDFGGYYEESYLWVNWYLTKGITGNFRIDGIGASEIGKTVFLTREEAEAALKRGQTMYDELVKRLNLYRQGKIRRPNNDLPTSAKRGGDMNT